MKLTVDEFRAWENKCITLLGMSGVGKTWIATRLRQDHWFHYSGDYRIGTRYLDEAILDNIKQQAMQIPFLRDLLRSDSIYIRNNISVHNLQPVSSFLGMLGSPDKGGLQLKEFRRRQHLHRDAEIAAMKDVPEFIRKAKEIYGYQHFINDAGGSLCELDDPEVIDVLDRHTLILYIEASEHDKELLFERASKDPKPLYYREEFLDTELEIYMAENDREYTAMIDPGEFTRWIFPRLMNARIPRYEAIARDHGYTVSSKEIAAVKNEADFLALLEDVIQRRG